MNQFVFWIPRSMSPKEMLPIQASKVINFINRVNKSLNELKANMSCDQIWMCNIKILTDFDAWYAWPIDKGDVLVVFWLVFVWSLKSHWLVKSDKCLILPTVMCCRHEASIIEVFYVCLESFSSGRWNLIELPYLTNEKFGWL